jgi:cytochrome c oxidase subunit 2
MLFVWGALILVGGYLIGSITPSILPVEASAEAGQIDTLFRVTMFIGGIVFLLVQGLLAYSVIRFRVRADDTGDGPNIHGNATLEIVWTTIPAVIVIFLAVYGWQVWNTMRAEKPNEMVVQTTAQRYAWSFTYTDPENRLAEADQQTFTVGTLHTYVNQPMLMKINALDVNHAFWVPVMRLKQDALVGRETEVRFTPTREGRYRVVCAELCGGGHGGMFTYIVVYADYEQYKREFLDIQVNNILNPPTDPFLVGQSVLSSAVYPCASCHTLQSADETINWTGITGPNLNGIGTRAGTTRAGATGLPDGASYIAQSIRHPNAYDVPGFALAMPQFGPFPEQPATIDGASYVYMPNSDLEGIVTYLCAQTESGVPEDSTCGDAAAIAAAVEAQSQ